MERKSRQLDNGMERRGFKMTLSQYCRLSGISLMGLSQKSGVSMRDIHDIYTRSIIEFEDFANKWSDK